MTTQIYAWSLDPALAYDAPLKRWVLLRAPRNPVPIAGQGEVVETVRGSDRMETRLAYWDRRRRTTR